MSISFGKGDLLFEQRLLKCGGFYDGKLDGVWGPQSEAAADAARADFVKVRNLYTAFDNRSEDNIATLLPKMQQYARMILGRANLWGKDVGCTVQIVSGTRTYAEQDVLFAQRPKVTNARGGQSWHNFGLAVDLGIFRNGKYLTGNSAAEDKLYVAMAAAIKTVSTQIEWGGDWTGGFKDKPHYQYATGLNITQARTKFERGQLVLS